MRRTAIAVIAALAVWAVVNALAGVLSAALLAALPTDNATLAYPLTLLVLLAKIVTPIVAAWLIYRKLSAAN